VTAGRVVRPAHPENPARVEPAGALKPRSISTL
jgi:hypothetical protein